MYDAVAPGELLIDFASVFADAEGYPTMEAHPALNRTFATGWTNEFS